MKEYETCRLCPRECGVDRRITTGYCGMGEELQLSRAALHMWEEPCISGTEGSGAIFFAGCNMGCIFCQNAQISQISQTSQISQISQREQAHSKQVTTERFAQIMLNLQAQGANNINLVTPTHFVPTIIQAVRLARAAGLTIPIVYNTSAYEKVETLRMLEDTVDIYLPDFKYWEESTAVRYSRAVNYPEYARAAIAEMVRQTKEAVFDERGMMKRGVIVRHLLLPEHLLEAKKILRFLYESYQNRIYYSLMSQYTPIRELPETPELNHKVKHSSYEKLVDFAISLGIENAYIQEEAAAMQSFIPAFDGTGL